MKMERIRERDVFLVTTVLLSIISASFVWFYKYPLCVDMPLHVTMGKAFLDLISGQELANYPYALDIKISSYSFAEIVIAPFIKLFGVVSGTKLLLSIYSLLFAYSTYYLAGQINPESRWTRLVGFPLALNYFFHWGFWPAMLAFITAIYGIGIAINYKNTGKGLFGIVSTRFLTLLFHPLPVLAVGCFDVVTCLVDVENNPHWKNPLKWNWGEMLKRWWIPLLFTLIMYLSLDFKSNGMVWASLKVQLIQVIRPLYLTAHWWESFLPLLLAGFISLAVFYFILRSKGKNRNLLIASVFIVLVGLCLPRQGFLRGWEMGARVVLIGLVLLFSMWSIYEAKLKKYIIIWVVLFFSINQISSHVLWGRHSDSFNRVIRVVHQHCAGWELGTTYSGTDNTPAIAIGFHAASWAWCLGDIAYTDDNVLPIHGFGPVRFRGIDSLGEAGMNRGEIVYHPYEYIVPDSGAIGLETLGRDSIYTIYRR